MNVINLLLENLITEKYIRNLKIIYGRRGGGGLDLATCNLYVEKIKVLNIFYVL